MVVRYRFTRVWSRLMVIVGIVFIALGVVSAAIALFTDEWRPGVTGTQEAIERALLVSALIMSGILAGSPFIVFGQLLEIFLDQRRLLGRIDRRLRRAKAVPAAKKPDAYPRL